MVHESVILQESNELIKLDRLIYIPTSVFVSVVTGEEKFELEWRDRYKKSFLYMIYQHVVWRELRYLNGYCSVAFSLYDYRADLLKTYYLDSDLESVQQPFVSHEGNEVQIDYRYDFFNDLSHLERHQFAAKTVRVCQRRVIKINVL